MEPESSIKMARATENFLKREDIVEKKYSKFDLITAILSNYKHSDDIDIKKYKSKVFAEVLSACRDMNNLHHLGSITSKADLHEKIYNKIDMIETKTMLAKAEYQSKIKYNRLHQEFSDREVVIELLKELLTVQYYEHIQEYIKISPYANILIHFLNNNMKEKNEQYGKLKILLKKGFATFM